MWSTSPSINTPLPRFFTLIIAGGIPRRGRYRTWPNTRVLCIGSCRITATRPWHVAVWWWWWADRDRELRHAPGPGWGHEATWLLCSTDIRPFSCPSATRFPCLWWSCEVFLVPWCVPSKGAAGQSTSGPSPLTAIPQAHVPWWNSEQHQWKVIFLVELL